jgi:hypothetical protein
VSAPESHLSIGELETLFAALGDLLDRIEPSRRVVVLTKAVMLLADRIGDPATVAQILRDAEQTVGE